MTSAPTDAPAGTSDYFQLSTREALDRLDVDAARGLTSPEVSRRRDLHGANELPSAAPVPAWRQLLRQFRDVLIGILLAAAAISFVVSGELKTPLVVLAVVGLNAVLGFVQERRAEASLDALRRMLVVQCRVRRDGELRTVPAHDLVPGDIVAVEAGDRIPADGRLLEAVRLEVDEAALTGESLPASKDTGPLTGEVALGDRRNLVFMHSTVTRGRAELVVTGTGTSTEIGRIAGLLAADPGTRTPLQEQLDGLAHSLAKLAGVIVGLVFLIGLARGQAVEDLFLTAVALAVAAIPEGLPAVTAVTLAIGVSNMAKRNAIVKRLASVETLGCTSVICSDKTGTLTLNQMTARELMVGGHLHHVSGGGYAPEGAIDAEGGPEVPLEPVLLPMALCSDAAVRRGDDGWELVGDPTEGALVVLAAKGGLDVAQLRSDHPRLAEVPFDSERKYMATVHELIGPDGPELHLFVKGAPDVLAARSSAVRAADGTPQPMAEARDRLEADAAALAHQGRRVLAVAGRRIDADRWAQMGGADGDVADLVEDLTLLALVGIVDPPRPEARAAIAEAHRAGIATKVITGDHADTAAAIGQELELAGPGRPVVAVTGSELDHMDDAELAARMDEISVFARVSPEHKLRLVSILQGRGDVVAMTGDGVNDAPALRRADIGVAMGITGTEVTKEAATMVLADDNFATIVGAVQRGRTIYDNIVSFVRFQLSTSLGFAVVFLAAATFDVASGKPFTAIAILWVNLIMDGPPAMALGLDRGDDDTMRRLPRPRSERILTRQRWVAVGLSAAVMAAGTLGVLVLAPGAEPRAGAATVAGTMAFTTFVLSQFFNLLNARSDRASVFSRHTFTNAKLWLALAGVLALQVAVTYVGWLQRLFDTTSITAGQWLVSAAVASAVIWVEEVRKLVLRRLRPLPAAPASSAGEADRVEPAPVSA